MQPISQSHFYSHTPHGVQQIAYAPCMGHTKFLLTHPSRGATVSGGKSLFSSVISTHTPLTGCNPCLYCPYNRNHISTHTPLTGCNETDTRERVEALNFYSHTPHGVQHIPLLLYLPLPSFLLTHPSRGATEKMIAHFIERPISTHTPLTGCNRKIMYFTANCTPYNVGVDFFKNLY